MSKTKILIADDDPDIRKVVCMRLEKKGYEVIQADSGEMALKKAKEILPDLFILDVNMPPPNGFQVCRTLKEDLQFQKIPVIFLTAKKTESDHFWGAEAGAEIYLTKPYEGDDLLQKIEELLQTQ